MGVPGWNRFLAEEGWIPKRQQHDCCSPSLWMDLALYTACNHPQQQAGDNNNNNHHHPLLSDRIVSIPPGSELHIDGYCLCFHLYETAYARYVESVLSEKQRSKFKRTFFKTEQVRHLLPSFLPMKLLSDVTREFVETLEQQHHNMKLQIYWDGEKRYVFKQGTTEKRQQNRNDEWSNLQQYCLYGTIPKVNSAYELVRHFPKHRLFVAQIMHSLLLSSVGNNNMVLCDGEADHILAHAATGKPNSYVVGLDSDFCFFPDINYIPISTLDARSRMVTAVVIRREEICQSLDLPDEASLIELAILIGNDYVDAANGQFLEAPARAKNGHYRMDELLAFLREKGPGYRVASMSEKTEEALRFVRCIYGLEDLSEFDWNEDDSSISAKEDSSLDSVSPVSSERPRLPDDCTDLLELARVQPLHDRSIKDAAMRCLRSYVDRNPADTALLTPKHLEAFEKLDIDVNQSYTEVDKIVATSGSWRPIWKDVCAVYLIERVIGHCVRTSLKTVAVRLHAPFTIFDQYKYHALLCASAEVPAIPVAVDHPLRPDPPTAADRSMLLDPPTVVERPILPVDEHEETILESVRKNRVTIIQGETGCGKSSRIPVMLLQAPPMDPSMGQAKLFISQPRRIAAKALVERLRAVEPDLRDQIALRLGHGVREYETPQTRAWFCTTGYLVRLMANNPDRFQSVSYIIIDEVHERSVDTDILCLLCRRLLSEQPHLRLVLMSATLAASLYQEYFQVPYPPIKVGSQRFPVQECYIEDLSKRLKLPGKEARIVEQLIRQDKEMKCMRPPAISYMEKLYSVTAYLATVVGQPGTSVLVFVPGMSDIVAISELVEQLYAPGVTYSCLPIHGDIPFDDQMHVFDAARPDEVKIVIATNAAESSVTLSDVDNVICLGLCKQIVYNETSHRQMLLPAWISKASATQRAGRTGRVRPGTVYRLYSRASFEMHMEKFEPGEMIRIPLDTVILMLKEMLSDEEVTDVLLSCLEPPNVATIDRSFQSLFQSHFITTPDDLCEITNLGAFVSALGIDLALGSLIGLGIQFGVGAEAIQMAGILSFPKPPWIISNPLIHGPSDYNKQTSKTFTSRCHFDANLYSEPLAAMNLLWEYARVSKNQREKWCRFHGVFSPRIKRLASTCNNLRLRVADFLDIDEKLLRVNVPPMCLPNGMVTVLRIIQVWVFHDTLIQFDPSAIHNHISRSRDNKAGGFTVLFEKNSKRIRAEHLGQLLRPERHPFELKSGYCEIQQKGSLECMNPAVQFSEHLEPRLLSYASEKQFATAWFSFADCMTLYLRENIANDPSFAGIFKELASRALDRCELKTRPFSGDTRRGLAERACGMWQRFLANENVQLSIPVAETQTTIRWVRLFIASHGKHESSLLESFIRKSREAAVSLVFPFRLDAVKPTAKFTAFVRGRDEGISVLDLRDLLSSPVSVTSTKAILSQQEIVFEMKDPSPLVFNGHNVQSQSDEATSWDRPLFKSIPEGARLLSVLASGRRREHLVRLPSGDEKSDADDRDEDHHLDVHLPYVTKLSHRWKRFNTDLTVYVEPNSVPASAVPLYGTDMLYCTCANTLEVRGGGLKAEGLTLLPMGKTFLLLARFTFGLFKQENVNDGSITKKALKWIDPDGQETTDQLLSSRILRAVSFHQSTQALGEKLECFPDKVEELLQVFHGVDGYESQLWGSIWSNQFVRKNLIKHKASNRKQRAVRIRGNPKTSTDILAEVVFDLQASNQEEKVKPTGDEAVVPRTAEMQVCAEAKKGAAGLTRILTFSSGDLRLSDDLFATSLNCGQQPQENDLHSSNILALVVEEVRKSFERNGSVTPMSLDGPDWHIYSIDIDSRTWYHARFMNFGGLAYIKRTSKNFPGWLKQNDVAKARPNTSSSALACIPRHLSSSVKPKVVTTEDGQNVILFDSLELAVRMEAAFYLDRQFLTGKRHWYQQSDISNMVGQIKKVYTYSKVPKIENGPKSRAPSNKDKKKKKSKTRGT